MKNILFILSVLAMMVVVGCSTPTTDNSVEEETVVTETQVEEEEVPEDKSPNEYVMPEGINMDDYMYIDDIIFSDVMDFTKWLYTNPSARYSDSYPTVDEPIIVLEKIARVNSKYPNDTSKQIITKLEGQEPVYHTKVTKYKLYLLKDFYNDNSLWKTTGINPAIIDTIDYYEGLEKYHPDGTGIIIQYRTHEQTARLYIFNPIVETQVDNRIDIDWYE